MAVKYLAYPEYKNTDSEWVSEIPVHWEPILFKRVITQIKDGTHGTHARVSEGFPFLSAKNVLHKGVEISDSESMVSEKDYREITANGFPKKGDLLITCVGTIGRTCVYEFDKPYAFQRSVAFLRLSGLAEPKFYKYFVESKNYQSQLEANSKASAQSGVYMGDLVSTSTVLLPKNEQKSIANFLDHETAQIDTLIEKQQTLIQLLKEKRQAVISYAVTKGLNQDALMKDSGVEWLGEVPAHWIVQSIKYAFKSLNFRRIPLSGEIRGERKGSFRYYGASGIIDYIDDYIFDESTVLVGEDGANLVSRSTPLAFSAHGKYWVNNHAHILKPKDHLADYWAEAIEHIDVNPIVTGSAQPKLTAEALSNLKITFPTDLNERIEIDSYIKSRKENYGNLIAKAEQTIQLMQERRTALISAAVTGKIDVRGWLAPDNA